MAAAAARGTGRWKARRPASQSANSKASGPPLGMGMLVQFCVAVRRKPPITAAVKPNSISCPCHSGGASPAGASSAPMSMPSQSAMEITANSPAARKKGLKPRAKRAKPWGADGGLEVWMEIMAMIVKKGRERVPASTEEPARGIRGDQAAAGAASGTWLAAGRFSRAPMVRRSHTSST